MTVRDTENHLTTERLLPLKEVSLLTGRAVETIRRDIRSGKIEAVRFPGSYRVSESAFRKYIEGLTCQNPTSRSIEKNIIYHGGMETPEDAFRLARRMRTSLNKH